MQDRTDVAAALDELVAQDDLPPDCMLATAAAEIRRLRRGWLRIIQMENSCRATCAPCDAKQCGCHAEQELLMKKADDAR